MLHNERSLTWQSPVEGSKFPLLYKHGLFKKFLNMIRKKNSPYQCHINTVENSLETIHANQDPDSKIYSV